MNSHVHLRHMEADRGFYSGKSCAFATMHGKEDVVSPVFRHALGMGVVVPSGIDTDQLGTFSGEVARAGSLEAAAVAKAYMAMKATGLSIGLSSEGSYGPHPQIPFISAGVEFMVLVDDERGIKIREVLLDRQPVYGHCLARDIAQAEEFLSGHKFPSHAVIVKPNIAAPGGTVIRKGLRDRDLLSTSIAEYAALSSDGLAFIQTDMRAHMNPTRMMAIRRLAENLAARINQSCPRCSSPGFGQIGVERGLVCEICRHPTDSVKYLVHGCSFCAHLEYRLRVDGRTHADAGACSHCNP